MAATATPLDKIIAAIEEQCGKDATDYTVRDEARELVTKALDEWMKNGGLGRQTDNTKTTLSRLSRGTIV